MPVVFYLYKHPTAEESIPTEEDPQLTERGRQDAREAALILRERNPTHLVASTALRCLETSTILSVPLGLTSQEVQEFTDPQDRKSDGRIVGPPTSFVELQESAMTALSFLSEEHEGSEANIVVVTHRRVIAAVLASIEGITNEDGIARFMDEHYGELEGIQSVVWNGEYFQLE